MGKLILCTGNVANIPFSFPITNVLLYSIEELCYYIYNHIYSIAEEDFTQAMIEWIKNELKMEDTAAKLQNTVQRKGNLKDFVVTILCSADYYEEQEIKDLIKIMDHLSEVSAAEKNKMKADNYLQYKDYKNAAKVYYEILENKDNILSSDLFYGNILHNLGMTKMHSSSYESAANTFKEAFSKNESKDSLLAYLLCLKLSKKEEKFLEAVQMYSVDSKTVENLIHTMDHVMMEAEEMEIYQEIKRMEVHKEEGMVDMYYAGIDAIIQKWKEEYKNGLV